MCAIAQLTHTSAKLGTNAAKQLNNIIISTVTVPVFTLLYVSSVSVPII